MDQRTKTVHLVGHYDAPLCLATLDRAARGVPFEFLTRRSEATCAECKRIVKLIDDRVESDAHVFNTADAVEAR